MADTMKPIPTIAGARARRAMEEAPLPAGLPSASQPRRTADAVATRRAAQQREPISPGYEGEPGESLIERFAAEEYARDNPPPPPPDPTEHEVAFSRGPARRPQPRVADPLLQWASSLPTNDRRIYAGWLVEAGKSDPLDDAMGQAGYPTVAIKHGSGNVVTHWALETANLFFVADGVQSIGEMKQTSERFGVAFGWRTLENGRAQSQLRARVFVRELLAVGYQEPLLLTVKGTLTGDLLTALGHQYRVLDTSAALRKESGKNPDLPFYAFSIPIGPGTEVTRGSGSATKEITPMVAAIPEPVSKDYLMAHWIKRGWVAAIESRIQETIRWSEAESASIAAGADTSGEGGEGL